MPSAASTCSSSTRPGWASAHATSRAVSTCRPSPPARSARWATASAVASLPSACSPRAIRVSMSALASGSSRNRVLRLRSGGLTSKNGFSVVAPISVSVPSSTAGSRASCWALEKRWISSRNRIVPRPCSPSRWRARSMTSRTSLTPAVTALSCSNARLVLPATARASVVFPVPGGPQKMALVSRSCSTRRRSGLPDPTKWVWPTTSSRFFGRSRAASGAWARRRSSAAAANRSDTPPTVAPRPSPTTPGLLGLNLAIGRTGAGSLRVACGSGPQNQTGIDASRARQRVDRTRS